MFCIQNILFNYLFLNYSLKHNFLLRFLTTGSIEEKIYQRQISKTGLSEAVVDSNHFSSMKLSPSELKVCYKITVMVLNQNLNYGIYF